MGASGATEQICLLVVCLLWLFALLLDLVIAVLVRQLSAQPRLAPTASTQTRRPKRLVGLTAGSVSPLTQEGRRRQRAQQQAIWADSDTEGEDGVSPPFCSSHTVFRHKAWSTDILLVATPILGSVLTPASTAGLLGTGEGDTIAASASLLCTEKTKAQSAKAGECATPAYDIRPLSLALRQARAAAFLPASVSLPTHHASCRHRT